MRIGIASLLTVLLTAWSSAGIVHAHEGPLDAHGCHYDRNVGGYHCHKGTFAGHYFESREEMLQLLQLHMAEPRPGGESEFEPLPEDFLAPLDEDD